MLRREGDGHDGQADEEGVPEVQRRHGGVLVAKFVLGPHAAFAGGAVHRVDEAEGAGFLADGAGNVWVREQARRHAGPESEDDEGDEVADGHCAAAGFVEARASGTAVGVAEGLVVQREVQAAIRGGVVEEPDQEEDGAGDVNEGIDAIRPVEYE